MFSYHETSKRRLHGYQNAAIDFAIRKYLEGHPGVAWFLEPGLGKTICTLKLIQTLRAMENVQRTLVVAPKRVAMTVWPEEIREWGLPLTCSVAIGTPNQRLAALDSSSDIILTNPENVPWLLKQKQAFDFLVLDESTKFKSWTAQRTRALRKMLPDLRLILTGTPAANGYHELFAQMFMIDNGERLGVNITRFREAYMRQGGFENRQWFMRNGSEEKIRSKIQDICLYQSAVDNLDMPEVVGHTIMAKLPPKAQAAYDKVEAGLLPDGNMQVSSVLELGAKYTKCKQIASGSCYVDDEVVEWHEAKLDILNDLWDELNGKPIIVAYNFAHDWRAIQKRFPFAHNVDGKVRDIPADFQILACQVQALSHGVDGLQHKCADVAWFSLTDSREIFDQFNARIYRQGQKEKQVRFHYILTDKTIDVPIYRSLIRKGNLQSELLSYLRRDDNCSG